MPIKKDSPYTKNTLRPNPKTADPGRPDPLTYLQEEINVQHIGDSWAADANVVTGLPKVGVKPGGLGLDDEVTEGPANIRRPLR